jgi:alkanesulfonate monooxygenase SsuD/methylene tetrahydromethanopterin reductase-like flavin-dependent oxidoreductase (luciferase family)
MSVLIAVTLTPDLRTGPAVAKTLDGHADFVLVPDGPEGLGGLEFASWIGSLTTCLGLVPEVRATHLKPFHTATASAALDHVTRSRAGLAVGISDAPNEVDLFGRLDPAPAVAAWAEAGAIIDVIRRAWDSGNADAIIRDSASGRCSDCDGLHRAEAQPQDSTGAEHSTPGTSAASQMSQDHPPIVVRAEPGNEAARTAADIVLVDETAGEVSLEDLRSELEPTAAVLTVLPAPRTRAEVAELVRSVWILTGRGASGVLLTAPADEQLELSVRLVSEIIPALQAAGLRETPAQPAPTQPDLRTRLGLGPADRLCARA